MSKKNKAAETIQDEQPQPAPLPPPAPSPADESVSKGQIWTFWLGVAAALVTARVLNAMLPGISESVIERWVMLGLGAFLVLFLLKLK